MGRDLDVPSILYGRITKVPGDESSIIVNLELVNTSDGSQRWSMERTVKTLEHSLLVNEIVTSVSSTIGLNLTVDEKKKRDAEALYVKGRNAWSKRKTADIEQAIGHFQQAVDLNPNYALAYAGLADCYNMLGPTAAGRRPRHFARLAKRPPNPWRWTINLPKAMPRLPMQLSVVTGIGRKPRKNTNKRLRSTTITPGHTFGMGLCWRRRAALAKRSKRLNELSRLKRRRPLSPSNSDWSTTSSISTRKR